MPRIDPASLTRESASPVRFTARSSGESVTLLPLARVHHQHYSVYWLTGEPPTPPPAFAAWHRFDETSGTTAADATGNGRTAQLVGGVSWSSEGKIAGAVVLNGDGGYIRAADDVLAGASTYSIATWIKLDGQPSAWSRIFDFGTGTTANMFLTPLSDAGTLRFAITASGAANEAQINADPLPVGVWTHVAVTYGSGTAVLYVNGEEAGRNAAVHRTPGDFGNHIRANYLGRSQYSDPYLKGSIDDFRIHGETLTAAEIAALAKG